MLAPETKEKQLSAPIFVLTEERSFSCACSHTTASSCRRSFSLSLFRLRVDARPSSSSPHQPSAFEQEKNESSLSLPYFRIASAALMPFLHCLES